jgi:exodeoxyribonuclease V beta subunit
MNGFIDLVFKAPGTEKIYIIDWKTNYLADSPESYDEDTMTGAILDNLYPVQYYIYSNAIHRYMSLKIGGYSQDMRQAYSHHFGGVFYLFLRGMEAGGVSGIYFDRPHYEIIRAME